MDDTRYKLDNFELYCIARQFRKRVYRLMKLLPPEERYCLEQQMQRAAVSITNNIAEGHGRWHFQENIQFCRIARGSVEEIIDDLNTCEDERYGDSSLVAELKEEAYNLIAKIHGYLVYLRKKTSEQSSTLTTHDSTNHHSPT